MEPSAPSPEATSLYAMATAPADRIFGALIGMFWWVAFCLFLRGFQHTFLAYHYPLVSLGILVLWLGQLVLIRSYRTLMISIIVATVLTPLTIVGLGLFFLMICRERHFFL